MITTHGSYTHASPPTIKEGDEVDECIRLDHPPAKKTKSGKSGASNLWHDEKEILKRSQVVSPSLQ